MTKDTVNLIFFNKKRTVEYKKISKELAKAIKYLKVISKDYLYKISHLASYIQNNNNDSLKKFKDKIKKAKKLSNIDYDGTKNETKLITSIESELSKLENKNTIEEKILKDIRMIKEKIFLLFSIINNQKKSIEKIEKGDLTERENLVKLFKFEGEVLFDIKLKDNKNLEEVLMDLLVKCQEFVSESNFKHNHLDRYEDSIKKIALKFIRKYNDPFKAFQQYMKFCQKYISNRSYVFMPQNREITYYYFHYFNQSLFEVGKRKKSVILYLLSSYSTLSRKVKERSKIVSQEIIKLNNILLKAYPNDIDNYTRIADFVVEDKLFLTKDLFVYAEHYIEKAQDLFSSRNIELLKLKAKLRSYYVKEKLGSDFKKPERWKKSGNIFSADEAYIVIKEVLDNLDKKVNREFLAQQLQKITKAKVSEKNFIGSKLTKISKKKMEKKFGLRFYPLTIVMPQKKWRDVSNLQESLQPLLTSESWAGGINIVYAKYSHPWNKIGGIRIIAEDFYNPHEEMHGTFEVYNYSSDAFVNELFAYISNIEKNDRTWKNIKEGLMTEYFYKYYPKVKGKEKEKLLDLISKAVDTVEMMHEVYDLKTVTKYLIKAKGLDVIVANYDRLKRVIKTYRNRNYQYAIKILQNLNNKQNRKLVYHLLKNQNQHKDLKEGHLINARLINVPDIKGHAIIHLDRNVCKEIIKKRGDDFQYFISNLNHNKYFKNLGLITIETGKVTAQR